MIFCVKSIKQIKKLVFGCLIFLFPPLDSSKIMQFLNTYIIYSTVLQRREARVSKKYLINISIFYQFVSQKDEEIQLIAPSDWGGFLVI